MLKLYGAARSRAAIIQWYLEELALPYEFISLDLQAGEHLQPAYRSINPFGKVPAIVDGDFCLWESGAILLYLAEKYGNVVDPQTRAILTQWVLFANATLTPPIFAETSREKEMPKLFPPLQEILEKQPFLLGEELSVADVAVGSMLGYMVMMLKLDYSAYPALSEYVKRIADRPAFHKTIGTIF